MLWLALSKLNTAKWPQPSKPPLTGTWDLLCHPVLDNSSSFAKETTSMSGPWPSLTHTPSFCSGHICQASPTPWGQWVANPLPKQAQRKEPQAGPCGGFYYQLCAVNPLTFSLLQAKFQGHLPSANPDQKYLKYPFLWMPRHNAIFHLQLMVTNSGRVNFTCTALAPVQCPYGQVKTLKSFQNFQDLTVGQKGQGGNDTCWELAVAENITYWT